MKIIIEEQAIDMNIIILTLLMWTVTPSTKYFSSLSICMKAAQERRINYYTAGHQYIANSMKKLGAD